jgi:hypothetical protein
LGGGSRRSCVLRPRFFDGPQLGFQRLADCGVLFKHLANLVTGVLRLLGCASVVWWRICIGHGGEALVGLNALLAKFLVFAQIVSPYFP